MKLLLIQSYLGQSEPVVFPLGLACLKPYLKDHEVNVFDMNTVEEPFQSLKGIVASFNPDLIGISLRNIDSTNKRKVVFYYKYTKKTIDIIKTCTDARIVMGGSGFSMFAREIMEDEPGIDYGVYLEGEVTFSELLKNLDTPESVKSIYYRRDGEIFFTGHRSYSSFEDLKPPDTTILPIDKYNGFPDALGVETKRGCQLNCIYCVYGFLNGNNYRLKSPGAVVDEIEALNKNQGAQRFTFIDSVFNIPQNHAEAVLREMIARKLDTKWSAWFSEKDLSSQFLALAKQAGCDHVIFSPDGFSDKTLTKLGKNIRKKDIIHAFKMIQGMDGFEISYNFFKNPPGQNLMNFISLVVFCLLAKLKLGRRIHFEFNSLRIEPHTRLYEVTLAENVITRDESLLFPKYYTNRKTWYIEAIFNILLRLIGR
jgi:radical SAM superfamily enzyme YgiQ (UPF0313 family)